MAKIRFLSAGESHGPKLSAIIEGLPAGFSICSNLINDDLKRRQQGFGRGGRMKIENDTVVFSAGIVEGLTTGAPIALEINNLDYKNWKNKDISPLSIPRPGHVDYAGAIKYDHDDFRLSLERASARETAMRTAVGSLCKQILQCFDISLGAYVTQIGGIKCEAPDHQIAYENSLKNEFAFPDLNKIEALHEEIFKVMKKKDTLGGSFIVFALNVPPGLGSYVHYDRKLDGIIAQALMSIPAMKAVEIGEGIKNSSLLGTKVHDEFKLEKKKVVRLSNRAGGLEAGVSNGMPIFAKVYMKPISTTLKPLRSIDFTTKKPESTVYERSDFCAVPRACVIGEAMLAHVLLNALADKIGGDAKAAMMDAFSKMKKGFSHDLNMKKSPWRFNYENFKE